jgi:tRNA 2-thiouridine synthesizing protein A
MYAVDVELDVRGLRCPMPLMKVSKALKDMANGQTIRVTATDPGSMSDFKGWTQKTGNTLLEAKEEGGIYTYTIRKGPA